MFDPIVTRGNGGPVLSSGFFNTATFLRHFGLETPIIPEKLRRRGSFGCRSWPYGLPSFATSFCLGGPHRSVWRTLRPHPKSRHGAAVNQDESI